jgi:radical SAM superfamily enzyme YgiQ (UPF0313 family)
MYKDLRFQQRKKEDIFRDIDRINEFFPKSRTAFLGDSNPLVHRDIVEIIEYLKAKHPEVERVTAYARAKTVANMPDDKLKALKDAGLSRLHIGLESGDEEVLKLINKGIRPEDAIKAGQKAGKYFELTFYVITGLGGVERSEKHAVNTAKVINASKPTFVRIRNLTVIPGTPLEELVSSYIKPLSALQQLRELRMLIENITANTYFTCDHVSNYLFTSRGPIFYGVNGYLPEQKEEMIDQIDDTIETVKALQKAGEKILTSNDMYRLGLISL